MNCNNAPTLALAAIEDESGSSFSPHTGRQSLGQARCSGAGGDTSAPVPMKLMGDLVAATADSAPPPLACPSILVTITCPTWRAAQPQTGGHQLSGVDTAALLFSQSPEHLHTPRQVKASLPPELLGLNMQCW